MHRVAIHQPGSYHQLQLETGPDPAPGPGQVAIETEAIGVNYADCVIRMGLYSSARELVGWPITPGFEVAGRVAATGAGVDDLEVGQSVFAVMLFGGYSSHVVVPRHQVFCMPDGWSPVEAAAFPTVALTAWYALRELCKLRPGMNVLVHSAAGGVGSFLVQMARIFDCRVIGVVGAGHKVAAVRELGADHVIDKSSEALWPAAERLAPAGYDIVLDANGVATLKQSYEHLAPAGRLVIYGFHSMLPRSAGAAGRDRQGQESGDSSGQESGDSSSGPPHSRLGRIGDALRLPGRGRPNFARLALSYLRTPRFDPLRMTNDNRSVLAFNLSYMFERGDLLDEAMGELLPWVAEQRLRLPRVTTHALRDVASAHADLESGQTVGKLVLIP